MAKAEKNEELEALKASAKKACQKAMEAYPNLSQAQQIKLAVACFILDEAGCSGDERKDAVNAFMATPNYFGASANTLTDGFGLIEKNSRGGALKDFTM